MVISKVTVFSSGEPQLKLDCAGKFVPNSFCPSRIGFSRVSFLVLFFPSKGQNQWGTFRNISWGELQACLFLLSTRGDSDAARPHHLLKSRAVLDLRNFLEFDLPPTEGISTFVSVVCFRVLEFDTQRFFAPVIRTLLAWLSFIPRSLSGWCFPFYFEASLLSKTFPLTEMVTTAWFWGAVKTDFTIKQRSVWPKLTVLYLEQGLSTWALLTFGTRHFSVGQVWGAPPALAVSLAPLPRCH